MTEVHGDAAWPAEPEVNPRPPEAATPRPLLEAILEQRMRRHTAESPAGNQIPDEALRTALHSMREVLGDARPPAATGKAPGDAAQDPPRPDAPPRKRR